MYTSEPGNEAPDVSRFWVSRCEHSHSKKWMLHLMVCGFECTNAM